MEKKLPVTLAHRKWECVYVVLDKREIKHTDKKSMKIREKESLRRQIEKEKRSYQSPWHIGNGTVCMWFWIKEKLKRIKLRDKESLRRQIDKKIRWKGKEVTSHPGTQEMGQPSSQWRHRQLLQSYTTEENRFVLWGKVNCVCYVLSSYFSKKIQFYCRNWGNGDSFFLL